MTRARRCRWTALPALVLWAPTVAAGPELPAAQPAQPPAGPELPAAQPTQPPAGPELPAAQPTQPPAGPELPPGTKSQEKSPAAEKQPATDPHGPRNAISLRPLAFFGYGVSVQYERFILPRWASIAGGIGYRYSGGGDYSGSTGSLSAHGRFWLIGRSIFTKLADRAMVGPYLEFGLTAAYTALTDDLEDRFIGSTFTLTETLMIGCRFNVGPFELSPALGMGVPTEFGHHLAAHTHVVLAFDGTIGWMF